jgi:hypothetical protein
MRFLTALIVYIFSSTAYAQNVSRAEINSALESIKSIPLKHNGQEGVWFPKDDAEIILSIIEEKLPLTLDIIDKQSEQIKLLETALTSYKASNEHYKELVGLHRQMFDTAMKYLPKLDAPDPAWYETTKATYIYGVITGAALIVGAAWVLDNTVGAQ